MWGWLLVPSFFQKEERKKEITMGKGVGLATSAAVTCGHLSPQLDLVSGVWASPYD